MLKNEIEDQLDYRNGIGGVLWSRSRIEVQRPLQNDVPTIRGDDVDQLRCCPT